MKRACWWLLITAVAVLLGLAGCNAEGKTDPAAGAPPPAKVEDENSADLFKVDHPEQYPLAVAVQHVMTPELNVTGTVAPDVSRNVPVISMASGRIIEVRAKLGDTVTKGQLLLTVQSTDIGQAFSEYRQALADQKLAKSQLDRAKVLLEHGAIAQKDVDVAEDAEAKTAVAVQTALDHLKVLGADPGNPTSVVNVYAPASGVITDQQVTAAAGTQGLASPNAFTISDLSHVWIVFDVYENDLHFVHVGEYADIHLTAYPNLTLRGRIDNISPVLDPNLRTAKVRLEVPNSGVLRFGMFVTATFHGMGREARAVVPASAVLHLHDRDWVYVPAGGSRFRRVGIQGGDLLPSNMQIVSGIAPGQQVVQNALVLQATVE